MTRRISDLRHEVVLVECPDSFENIAEQFDISSKFGLAKKLVVNSKSGVLPCSRTIGDLVVNSDSI